MKKCAVGLIGMVAAFQMMDVNAGFADILKGKFRKSPQKSEVVVPVKDNNTKSDVVKPSDSEAKGLMMQARNLFVAIVIANTEREAAGLEPVWPNTIQRSNCDEIAGTAFRDSVSYFKTLLDVENYANAIKWLPYVGEVKPTVVCGGGGKMFR